MFLKWNHILSSQRGCSWSLLLDAFLVKKPFAETSQAGILWSGNHPWQKTELNVKYQLEITAMCNYLRHLLHPGNSKIATLDDDLEDISFPPNQPFWLSIAPSSTTNSLNQPVLRPAGSKGWYRAFGRGVRRIHQLAHFFPEFFFKATIFPFTKMAPGKCCRQKVWEISARHTKISRKIQVFPWIVVPQNGWFMMENPF